MFVIDYEKIYDEQSVILKHNVSVIIILETHEIYLTLDKEKYNFSCSLKSRNITNIDGHVED